MSSNPCFCAYNRTMDLRTPRNVKLSGFFRRSFAFRTVRDRWPIILTKIIDSLSQNRESISREFGNEATDEVKAIIGKISRLKYEIQTNKPLKAFSSNSPDARIYNECIRERDGQEGPPTPYHSIWLLAECYMYRKVWEAFEKTKYLKEFDPYLNGKKELFETALPQIKETMTFLQETLNNAEPSQENFCSLLEMNLWSNKCDLSLNPNGVSPIFAKEIRGLSNNILVNDSEKIWNALCSSEPGTIDIVLDNAGVELISDFAIADYLTSKGICKKVNFHLKKIPWFLSDVTSDDLKWTFEQFNKMYEDPIYQNMGDNWSRNIENNIWEIKQNDFWILPSEFMMMHKYDRDLYQELTESKMIFFKGDLTYRKLFRESYHNPECSLYEGQGIFAPSNLCIIRCIKSEIICGLPKGVADKCEETDDKWMETGNYGVIQFTDKIIPLLDIDYLNKLLNKTIHAGGERFFTTKTENVAGTECRCRN